jgi:hypothetical protein
MRRIGNILAYSESEILNLERVITNNASIIWQLF